MTYVEKLKLLHSKLSVKDVKVTHGRYSWGVTDIGFWMQSPRPSSVRMEIANLLWKELHK